jgi:hypothetical protein
MRLIAPIPEAIFFEIVSMCTLHERFSSILTPKLHIDPNVKPVAQPERRIPFHIREKVTHVLDNLTKQGIIEPCSGPTPWVSPLVVVPKPKNPEETRICVDMHMPNTAIIRERLPMPTADELIHKLNGAKVFSKLDLRHGYHQILLTPESRYITTFRTHKGLHRYVRLNYGTSAASEVFQYAISQAIAGIDGVVNISDDIFIFGKTQINHEFMTQPLKLYLNDCDKSASPSTNRNVLITRVHCSSLV